MTQKHKAMIVDDEASARNILSQLLAFHCPFIELVDSCEDLKTAAVSIKKHKPDVVFLDIEMPNYAGYEITSFFEEIDFEIIFVTAYDNYAIKAFEMAAFDYLLKPIETERLIKTMERFKSKSDAHDVALNYQILKEGLSKSPNQKIIVNHKGDQKAIEIDSIVALEANESYTLIFTVDDGKYMMSKNLKYFENLLSDYPNFFRAHKSWIINIHFLSRFSKKEMNVYLENDIVAKLSKYKKQEFDQLVLEI